MTEHYFSPTPTSDERTHTLTVTLAGRRVVLHAANGVFSGRRLDLGTQILLDAVPPPPAGNLLDLGCGWGPISLSAALQSVQTQVWALDVNERALRLVERNAQTLGLANVRPVTAAEVPAPLQFEAIWSNPPIRIGKPALHELLRTWLPRLTPDGVAHLVVARNLGADSLRDWLEETTGRRVDRAASAKGYRVLRVGPAA